MLESLYSMVVVTNAIVMCFEIETTKLVPTACPDGIVGCCVYHTKRVTTKQYVPCNHNLPPNADCERGIGFMPAIRERIALECARLDTPDMTPIRAAGSEGFGNGPLIGWIWRQGLIDAFYSFDNKKEADSKEGK